MKRSAIAIFGCVAIGGALVYKQHLDNTDIQEYVGPQLPKPEHIAHIGDHVSPLQLTSLKGQDYTLGADTDRPVLVHFWASWCAPCVAELPSFEANYAEFARRGITLLSVAQDDQEHAEDVATRYGITFPVLLADGASTNPLLALGSAQGEVPFNVLLNTHGVVLSQKIGVVGASEMLDWAGKGIASNGHAD